MADRNFFDNRDGGRGFGDARGGYDSSRAYSDFSRGGDRRASGQQSGYQSDYRPAGGYQPQSVPMYGGGGSSVAISYPRTYQDVQNLIDRLRMREQVIVDFSNLNQQSVFRILDFLSGAIYALGGSVKQLRNNMFLFVPAGVTITAPKIGNN